MIRADIYRLFRTKSLYVIWIVLAAMLVLNTALLRMEDSGTSKEADTAYEEQTDDEDDGENIELGMVMDLSTAEGEDVTVYHVFYATSQAKFFALFLVIFAVLYATADFGSGYIKNIAGQVQGRGFLIVSKAVGLAVFTVLTLVGSVLLQAAANGIVFGYVKWGDGKAFLAYFLTELLLHYAFVVTVMSIAVIVKNNVVSMILAICVTMDVMILVYGLMDKAVHRMGFSDFETYHYTVSGNISSLSMTPGRSDCLFAVGVAAVFIVVMTVLGSVIFQKRDI
jgi:ABC-2 type transport system permease protein